MPQGRILGHQFSGLAWFHLREVQHGLEGFETVQMNQLDMLPFLGASVGD